MNYLTPADLIAKGLRLPALRQEPQAAPVGARCAITGKPLERGYLVADMVTDATAEFLDCFRGGVDGWVSEEAARCFKKSDPRDGNPCARSFLIFEDGAAYLPLIARKAAREQGRPAWCELVHQVWPQRAGQRCLVILTTDTKKRLWIRARVGQLGARTPVLAYDAETGLNEVLFVDWVALLACLDAVSAAYDAGFPKAAIRDSLYLTGKLCQEVGLYKTRLFEQELAKWRRRPEMAMASLIAQHKEEAGEQGQLDLGIA